MTSRPLLAPALAPTAPPAAPRAASTPEPGAPTDGPSLADFKPSFVRKAKVVTTPVTTGGVAALAGLSTTASIVAGVAIGGTVGLVAGGAVGALLDLIHIGRNSKLTGKLALLGCVAGAAAGGFGASLLPHVATGIALGSLGVLLGAGIAKAQLKSLSRKVAGEVNEQTRNGKSHISKLFRQVYDSEAGAVATTERDVRACERLEKAGWHFGTTADELRRHVTSSYGATFETFAPDGAHQTLPAQSLPTLAYLAGVGDAKDLDNVGLVDAVKQLSDQGRPLAVNDWHLQEAARTPQDGLIRLAGACNALAAGHEAAFVHDGVAMKVEAKDAATLQAAVKTVDALVASYDQNLLPVFQSGKVDGSRRSQVLETLLRTPYSTDLSRSVPLLTQLVAATPGRNVGDQTWQALNMMETLAKTDSDGLSYDNKIKDAITLSARMPRDRVLETLAQMNETLSSVDVAQVDRYHDCFMRVLRSTGDRAPLAARAVQILAGTGGDAAEAQVSALERLAAAAAPQKDYADIMLDHATLMATRRSDEPLETSVNRYARLLDDFASAGKADQAAPTYAFLKAALRDNRAVSTDEDALIRKVLDGAKSGDIDAARASVLKPGGGDGTETVDASRLAKVLDARTADRTAHLLSVLPPQDVEAHLGVLETLGKGAAYQKDYHDLLLDYATLMGMRDPQAPLQQSAQEYSDLMAGLASMNKASEAAPTYAFLRSGITHGRFGNATVPDLSEKLLTNMLAGSDIRRARQNLLASAPSSSNGTVVRDDKVVVIGGVAIPVNH